MIFSTEESIYEDLMALVMTLEMEEIRFFERGLYEEDDRISCIFKSLSEEFIMTVEFPLCTFRMSGSILLLIFLRANNSTLEILGWGNLL